MKTVLLIEDNSEIRENMGEILELAGYRVLLAPNGKEGVSFAVNDKPDVIVCDIMMPELDGYGVIHLLQKNPDTQQIPFIFLTAKAERSEMRKGMELGADDYITKPFTGTELLQAIEGRLRKSEALQSARPANLQGLNNLIDQSNNKSLRQLFDETQEGRSFQKKERIYSEGRRAYHLYYVAEGKVKAFKTNEDGKDLIIAIYQEGDFFGYTALLEGGIYHESAEALEPSEITSIGREAFEALFNNNPEVMRQFVKLLAGNVHEREEQLLSIAYNSLRKKVAEALIMLHHKYSSKEGDPVPMHISRDNLAAIAGTAKESLIRTLGDFRDEGLIEMRGTNIVVLKEQKLAQLLN
ncbi:MAG: response regulator [Bacteroidetes bacterium]|nr:response regulator [Bacteroidota bacterium]MBS1628869.1 response regulator [Bacteroidota bacterium]